MSTQEEVELRAERDKWREECLRLMRAACEADSVLTAQHNARVLFPAFAEELYPGPGCACGYCVRAR